MSLDVYLRLDEETVVQTAPTICIRENGQNRTITREEWDRRFPGREPFVAESECTTDCVYSSNITHNLGQMAEEAGLYKYLWRPEEVGVETAAELIVPLMEGLGRLQANPERFKLFNPPNGWGDYELLVAFTTNYLLACMTWPKAKVSVWR
jgi:hypothetical protein